MKKEEKEVGIVREIHLGGLNTSVHLMSTDDKETIVFLLEKGLSALERIKEDGERK